MMIGRSRELITQRSEVRSPGSDGRAATPGGRRRPLTSRASALSARGGLRALRGPALSERPRLAAADARDEILPARSAVLAETETVLARRLMLRSALAERQEDGPDMAAVLAAGEAPALTESVDPSLRDPGPIDAGPEGRELVAFATADDRPRARAVDLKMDPALLEDLGPALPLGRFKV